jgi:hypothetical protein
LPQLETDARESELRLRAERRRDRSEPGVSESVNGWEVFYNFLSDKTVSARRACEGIGTDRLGAYGHWLYRSAQLGDAKAALRFGEGGWLAPNDYTIIDDEAEVDFWRQHALEMMQRALAEGELRASLELAVSFGDIEGFLVFPSEGQSLNLYLALQPNGVESLAYLHVAMETGNCDTCEGYVVHLAYELGPEAAAAAKTEADRICATELAGRCKAPAAPDDGTSNR